MDDNDKIKLTLDELNGSRIDEELDSKQSIILSQEVEKVSLFSKADNRTLIKIGIIILFVLLIGLMIIWFKMKHSPQEQPPVKTKIYKADLSLKNKERLLCQTKFLIITAKTDLRLLNPWIKSNFASLKRQNLRNKL